MWDLDTRRVPLVLAPGPRVGCLSFPPRLASPHLPVRSIMSMFAALSQLDSSGDRNRNLGGPVGGAFGNTVNKLTAAVTGECHLFFVRRPRVVSLRSSRDGEVEDGPRRRVGFPPDVPRDESGCEVKCSTLTRVVASRAGRRGRGLPFARHGESESRRRHTTFRWGAQDSSDAKTKSWARRCEVLTRACPSSLPAPHRWLWLWQEEEKEEEGRRRRE